MGKYCLMVAGMSPQPGNIVPPATVTPRPNLPCHQRHRPTLSTPPSTCAQTTSTTEGSRISCWWIGTQTGQSSPDPRMEQRVSVESYEILSPPMASQRPSPPMAAQSLPPTPPGISYPHGVYSIERSPPTTPTPIAGLRQR